MSRSFMPFGVLPLMLLLPACYVAGPTPTGTAFDRSLSRTVRHETGIRRVGEDELMQLRPDFLRPNPTGRVPVGAVARPSVYIDNSYVGAVDALQLVPAASVTEVVLLPPSAAHDRFGAYCACDAGVLMVTTRHTR
jgi:hypothetical protein